LIFQGIVNPPHHAIFRISGKKKTSTEEEDEDEDIANLSGRANSTADSVISTPSDSSNVNEEEEEDGDSIDSELVRRALDKLDMEEQEEEDLATMEDGQEKYTTTVFDFETGQHHRLEDVRLASTKDSASLSSARLKFTSERCFRGAAADCVLVEQFGPSFADSGLLAFRGRVQFDYADKLCYPVALAATQWCM